jgi:hypothetical protein
MRIATKANTKKKFKFELGFKNGPQPKVRLLPPLSNSHQSSTMVCKKNKNPFL